MDGKDVVHGKKNRSTFHCASRRRTSRRSETTCSKAASNFFLSIGLGWVGVTMRESVLDGQLNFAVFVQSEQFQNCAIKNKGVAVTDFLDLLDHDITQVITVMLL